MNETNDCDADDMTDALETIEKLRAAIEVTDANVERLARVLSKARRDPENYAWFHSDPSKCRLSKAMARAILAAIGETVGQAPAPVKATP